MALTDDSSAAACDPEILEAVELFRQDLIDLTVEFVSFPTVNPPGTNLAACQRWICEQLDRFDIDVEVIDSSTTGGDHKIIVGTIGDEGPVMYMHGHYDVVPAFAEEQFVAVESDGSLFGRGTSDMKGGLVAMMLAAVIHRNLEGGGMVKLVFVPDEETGGMNGSERLEELGVITPAAAIGAIVAEPSFPDIWYAARAAFTVKVTVTGRAAHVGLHYTGTNAFIEAHQVLAELISYGDRVAQHQTSLRIEPEAARSSIMLIGGMAGGGTNFNIVPDSFSFTIDRRPNPDEDYVTVKRELLAKLDELATDHALEYEIIQDVDPAFTSPDSPLVESIVRLMPSVAGRHAALSMCPGCLETRIYSRAGIDAVAFGPGPMNVMHAPDEHVPVRNLIEACAVYVSLLRESLGQIGSEQSLTATPKR